MTLNVFVAVRITAKIDERKSAVRMVSNTLAIANCTGQLAFHGVELASIRLEKPVGVSEAVKTFRRVDLQELLRSGCAE